VIRVIHINRSSRCREEKCRRGSLRRAGKRNFDMINIPRCGPSRNPVPSILSVYDGTTCRGHLLNRGKAGGEAFNADDKSLGTYPTS
jgi:hypothetical protein